MNIIRELRHCVFRLRVGVFTLVACFGIAMVSHAGETQLNCFRNTADAQLKAKFGFGIYRIPVCTGTGDWLYTAEVQNVLQAAADVAQSTVPDSDYPLAFRPLFFREKGTNYIAGYAEVTNSAFLDKSFQKITVPWLPSDANIYGVPIVFGTKKGIPNFNEFSSVTRLSVARKLIFYKDKPNNLPNLTNQLYWMCFSNAYGIELWNSSSAAYPHAVRVLTENQGTLFLTNESRGGMTTSFTSRVTTELPAGAWSGWNASSSTQSFLKVTGEPACSMPWSGYVESLRNFSGTSSVPAMGISGLPVHDWTVRMTNCVTAWIVDEETDRLLDYVSFYCGVSSNASSLLITANPLVWDMTGANNSLQSPASTGVVNQIRISMGIIAPPSPYGWFTLETESFRRFMYGLTTNLQCIAPYQPVNFITLKSCWQTGDPARHYMAQDLVEERAAQSVRFALTDFGKELSSFPCSIGNLNVTRPPLLSAENCFVRRGGTMSLRFFGNGDMVYDVWSSTNLADWFLSGHALSFTNNFFIYNVSAGQKACFFRVVPGIQPVPWLNSQ